MGIVQLICLSLRKNSVLFLYTEFSTGIMMMVACLCCLWLTAAISLLVLKRGGKSQSKAPVPGLSRSYTSAASLWMQRSCTAVYVGGRPHGQ